MRLPQRHFFRDFSQMRKRKFNRKSGAKDWIRIVCQKRTRAWMIRARVAGPVRQCAEDRLHFRHFDGGRGLGGVIESHLHLGAGRKAFHCHTFGQHVS